MSSAMVAGRRGGRCVEMEKRLTCRWRIMWQIREGLAVRFRPYIDNPTMLAALKA